MALDCQLVCQCILLYPLYSTFGLSVFFYFKVYNFFLFEFTCHFLDWICYVYSTLLYLSFYLTFRVFECNHYDGRNELINESRYLQMFQRVNIGKQVNLIDIQYFYVKYFHSFWSIICWVLLTFDWLLSITFWNLIDSRLSIVLTYFLIS